MTQLVIGIVSIFEHEILCQHEPRGSKDFGLALSKNIKRTFVDF